MITRQYFMHFEIWKDGNVKSVHFRQFWIKSFFKINPGDILKDKIKDICEQENIDKSNVIVTSFNSL